VKIREPSHKLTSASSYSFKLLRTSHSNLTTHLVKPKQCEVLQSETQFINAFFPFLRRVFLFLIHRCIYLTLSWSSSVSILSDYRLDDRGSTPAEVKDFSFSLCVQTSSEATQHLSNEYRRSSPRVKRARVVRLTTHPHLVKNE
jgi:hypothetical protein